MQFESPGQNHQNTGAIPIPTALILILRSARRVAILTGAGVSKESGVPEPLFDFSNRAH
jgi:hypothetical protein